MRLRLACGMHPRAVPGAGETIIADSVAPEAGLG